MISISSMRPVTHYGASASRLGATQVLKAVHGQPSASSSMRSLYIVAISSTSHSQPQWRRGISTSNRLGKITEYFPEPEAPHIRRTKAAWPHPIYTEEQMRMVEVSHRDPRDLSDKFALTAVKIMRWFMDRATGYSHTKATELNKMDPEAAKKRYAQTEKTYLLRNVFLESVAGVPGMVAGMLRHLHSMRRMKRDNGWIETLLEESYNERMHLLIFMKMYEPGLFMRLMVLGAQGVFFNAMFISYLISPRTCHRFVGYLEEEAVLTYTKEIEAIEQGRLPGWENLHAPQIAIDYYNMPEGQRMMRDLLYFIRADESKHREVNSTLANLDQKNDPNPYTSEYKDDATPHPRKDLKFQKPQGWERDEVI